MSIHALKKKKSEGKKIVSVTAYTYYQALMLKDLAFDMVLVGDSLGMVEAGYENTLPVTMDEVLWHTRAVRRGLPGKEIVISDMPFLSYQVGEDEAMRNSGRFLKEAGATGVKLEGGKRVAGLTKRLTENGIPVLGHIGLTPQSLRQLGGYKVKGKTSPEVAEMKEDIHALEDAGAFAVVMETVPAVLGEALSKEVKIPTIGIGAGAGCDGQILVLHDVLGMFPKMRPKFSKQYADFYEEGREALKKYQKEVSEGIFPGEEHSF